MDGLQGRLGGRLRDWGKGGVYWGQAYETPL